jgi:orotidine-5'-phosphate decarboxylase
LELLAPHLCAVKVNRHLLLPLGLFPYVKKLVKAAHNLKLPVIMDCKINDIGDTNLEMARHYFNADFDAITANPFIGWEGGLEPIFRMARDSNKGILLLIYMSHKGANEGYGQLVMDSQTGSVQPQYLVFAKKALQWGADGAIVGATHPNIIQEVNQFLINNIPIYSPGIGIQGGRLQSVLASGTRYLIIGRYILQSSDPLKSVKELKITYNRLLSPQKNLL